jgi:hypothetical protein
MDGFDQDEAAGERDERGIVLGSFFAPERNALETLELAHGLLDPSAAPIEGLGKKGGRYLALARRGMIGQMCRSRAA